VFLTRQVHQYVRGIESARRKHGVWDREGFAATWEFEAQEQAGSTEGSQSVVVTPGSGLDEGIERLACRWPKKIQVGADQIGKHETASPANEKFEFNSYAERWLRSVKEECLSRLILFGESSLRRALQQYERCDEDDQHELSVSSRLAVTID
jgi:hypothetical protein